MKIRMMGAALAVMAFAGFAAAPAAARDAYPDKPITILVPFAPGGNVDLSTRIVAQHMSEELGQSILVTNRTGAGGLIAYEAVSRAQPDGYTLATMAASSLIVTPRLVPRDDLPLSSYTLIGAITDSPMVLLVPAESPYRTVEEYVAAARDKPGVLTIGHSGNGTTGHVAILSFQDGTDIDLNVIPYKGAAPALVDLLGGQLDSVIDQVTSSLQHVQSGKLRPLAVLGSERIADLPDVPTMQESGVKDYDVAATTGLIGPAGLSPAVVERLNAALNKALADSEVQARFQKMGAIVRPMTPRQFVERLEGEDAAAEDLMRRGILKVQ